jgi:hypothetical protein
MIRRFVFPACLLLPLLAASCRDAKVVTYRIPKEPDAPAAKSAAPHAGTAQNQMAGSPVAAAAGAELSWTAPASWRPKPASAMRKGSYAVGPADGTAADLSITAFPGDVGGDLANVNRWRGQIGLGEISAAELPATLARLDSASLPISYVDLANGPQRMLAAIVPFDGATWFFKLTGPDAIVAAEKTNFLAFLQTVKPAAGAPPPAAEVGVAAPASANMADTAVIQAGGPALKWTAPAHWQSRPAAAMRKASYAVVDPSGASADLSVTAFPGDVGGETANVNRWRNQLQLPPLADTELAAAVTHRTQGGLQLTIVDFASAPPSPPQRLLGAIVPFNGSTWFFKLTGPDALVAREKPAFLAFLDTLQAP